MRQWLRLLLIVGGIVNFVLAAGFILQMPWALNIWPWQDGRLTYIFIGSIFAAIGVAVIWIGVACDWAALPAGALNLLMMMGGIAAFMFTLSALPGNFTAYAIGAALLAIFNLGFFLTSRRLPTPDQQPTPNPVRISFGLFTLVLLLAGGALVMKLPNIMPWAIRPETSVMIGWIFVGDAFYFLYGMLRPVWQNARPQLWSFLVYDLVLIAPLVGHLANVLPQLRLSLLIYLAVIAYSGVLAAYYLLINRTTRVTNRAS